MKTLYWIAMVAVLAAGCTNGGDGGGSGGGGGAGGSGGEAPTGDACADLPGMTFRSVEEHECGLTPDGPELCNWRISFSLEQNRLRFDWQYSDVGESGDVICDDGALTTTAESSTSGPTTGTYDPATGMLVWGGIDYQPSPQ